MIRTQINLPGPLHDRLKRIAQERDWSLAEVIRRASELYAARFPAERVASEEWNLPPPLDLGEFLTDPAAMRVEAEVMTERTGR